VGVDSNNSFGATPRRAPLNFTGEVAFIFSSMSA
jgi:hypothetical protein